MPYRQNAHAEHVEEERRDFAELVVVAQESRRRHRRVALWVAAGVACAALAPFVVADMWPPQMGLELANSVRCQDVTWLYVRGALVPEEEWGACCLVRAR